MEQLQDRIDRAGPSRRAIRNRRHVVVRRLLSEGLQPGTLEALLPEWSELIEDVADEVGPNDPA